MSKKYQRLIAPALKKLPVGKQISEHGIEYKRLLSGDGSYAINVMVDGKRIHRVLGKTSEGITRKHAEIFIEKLRTEARENRLNLPKGRRLHMGFSSAAEQYIQRLEETNGKDLRTKKYRLKHHLKPFFQNMPLISITSHDVEIYKKQRLDRGTSPSSVNRELAVLSHLMNKSFEWGWIKNKTLVIHRCTENSGKIEYLTTKQCKALLDAAERSEIPGIYLFIKVGLGTGMRKMEILSIEIENIDCEKQTIYIPKAKAGDRLQPITKELSLYLDSYLRSLPKDQKWLFPSSTSKTGHQTEIRKAFIQCVKAACLDPDKIVRHTLRHTAITHLVQAGVDLPTVKRISGHKTLRMVERYAHQCGEHIQQAVDKLEERYKNVPDPAESSPLH